VLQLMHGQHPTGHLLEGQEPDLLGCNRAFAADAALASPSDAIGKPTWDMPGKTKPNSTAADDSRVMESGTPKLDYENHNHAGRLDHLASTAKSRCAMPPANVTAVLGMYEDITGAQAGRDAVRESQQRFQGLVETLSDWIWEVNPSGVYTYVSPKVRICWATSPQRSWVNAL